jgi:lysophospholipase L1-like esterase
VTLALAAASFVWLEEPIRRRRWSFRQSLTGAMAVTVPVAMAALLLPIERPGFWAGSSDAREQVEIDPDAPLTPVVPDDPSEPVDTSPDDTEPEPEDTETDAPTTTARTPSATSSPPRPGATTSTTAPRATTTTTTAASVPLLGGGAEVPALPETLSRPARVLVVGDSTASALGEGLVQFASERPELAQVSIRWSPACGFVRTGTAAGDLDDQFSGGCQMIRDALPDDIANLQPDVVVLMQTIADATARDLGDGGAALTPGDPGFADFLAAEYEAQLFDLIAWGADDVVWIIQPPQRLLTGGVVGLEAQPAIRAAIEQVAANHPDVVTVVDLEAWQDTQSEDLRPDGLHFSADGATRVANELLGPVVVELAAS